MDKLIDSIIRLFFKKDLGPFIVKFEKEREEIEHRRNEFINEPVTLSAQYLKDASQVNQKTIALLSSQAGMVDVVPIILELGKQQEERMRVVDRATQTQIQRMSDLEQRYSDASFAFETAGLDGVKWIGTLSTAILALSVGFVGTVNYIDIAQKGLNNLLTLGLSLLAISIILCLDYVRRTITRGFKTIHNIFKQRLGLKGKNYNIIIFESLRQRFVAYATYYTFFMAIMSLFSMLIFRLHFVSGIYFYCFFAVLASCLFVYLKNDFLSY